MKIGSFVKGVVKGTGYVLIACMILVSCDSSGSTDEKAVAGNGEGDALEIDQGKFTWTGSNYSAAYSGISRLNQSGEILEVYAPAHDYSFTIKIYNPPPAGSNRDADVQPLDDTLPTVLLSTGSYQTSWTSLSGTVSTAAVTGGVKCSFTVTMGNQGNTAPLTGYIIAYEK